MTAIDAAIRTRGPTWRMARFLRFMRGQKVPDETLIEVLWGDDPAGGPLDARNALDDMGRKLRARGIPVARVPYERAWVWQCNPELPLSRAEGAHPARSFDDLSCPTSGRPGSTSAAPAALS